MNVLVLGATGFVGAHLLAECARRGDRLAGTRRPEEGEPAGEGVAWHAVELLDSGSIEAALETARPEGIVHLAGQANVAAAARDPVGAFRVNAEGTWRVLQALRRVAPGARTVVVTSAEVYGTVAPERLPVREDEPLAPRTPYGAGKAAADVAAAQAAAGDGLAVMRARPFNHVGPGQRSGFVVPDLAGRVAAIERGEHEPVLEVGNLSPRRDFTDVRDIVRGYRDLLERGRAGAAYNLCSGRSVPIRAIVDYFVEHARAPIEVRTVERLVRPVDVPEFRGDPSRARRDLGWEPAIALEESLAAVLDEWRARRAGPGSR